jgi:hypothetical protein
LDLCRGSVTLSLAQADGSIVTRVFTAIPGKRLQITLLNTSSASSTTVTTPNASGTALASGGGVSETHVATSDVDVCETASSFG